MSEELNDLGLSVKHTELRKEEWKNNYPGHEVSFTAWAKGFDSGCDVKDKEIATAVKLIKFADGFAEYLLSLEGEDEEDEEDAMEWREEAKAFIKKHTVVKVD